MFERRPLLLLLLLLCIHCALYYPVSGRDNSSELIEQYPRQPSSSLEEIVSSREEDDGEEEEEEEEEEEDVGQGAPTPTPSQQSLHPPQPQPLKKAPFDEELDEKLFLILQNAVRETYFAFRDTLGSRYRSQLGSLGEELRNKLNQLDVDLNVKIVGLDTTTHSRIQSLTDQIIDQRKEDVQTFSDNLHQLQKTHQMHLDSQKVEIGQLQVTLELLNKGQSTISNKITQLQKLINNLESKVNEIAVKTSEDVQAVQERASNLNHIIGELQIDAKTSSAELSQVTMIVKELQKASSEDNGKLRRTLMRDQKAEPIALAIRHLRSKNIGGALKQWRAIESIADDLKETLPSDMSKILDESTSGKNPASLQTLGDFVHRAIAGGERRLKESAYSSLLNSDVLPPSPKSLLTDPKKTLEIFNLAQTMRADLGPYYNASSPSTLQLTSRLPPIIKQITFDPLRLLLPNRGYLRVAPDRKVNLVPPDGKYYDKDELLWSFEYDGNGERPDGTFYIKSDKLQKYLVTLQEGFNSYGFSKQGLFVTNKKSENGTRFQLTIVNGGEYVLLKSVHYNGYLTWKSNTQTVYGDDDQYFLTISDRKSQGPSPYWVIEEAGGGGDAE